MTTNSLIRGMAASSAIRFGTSAPYVLGRIRLEQVGFARIPRLVVTIDCREQDIPSLVPIARQEAYRWLLERGVDPRQPDGTIDTRPSVGADGTYRQHLFVDSNPSSESHGRRKRGRTYAFGFELGDMLKRAVSWDWAGRGTLNPLED